MYRLPHLYTISKIGYLHPLAAAECFTRWDTTGHGRLKDGKKCALLMTSSPSTSCTTNFFSLKTNWV